MLSVKDLHVYYGGIHALKGVSLGSSEGENCDLNRGERGRQEYAGCERSQSGFSAFRRHTL